MNINVCAQNFDMTEALELFVRERLYFALNRTADDIIAIDVYLEDINGPKGGVDKQAIIRTTLGNHRAIVIESVHENMYGAISTGIKRTKRAVRRARSKMTRIEKQRAWQLLRNDDLVAAQRQ